MEIRPVEPRRYMRAEGRKWKNQQALFATGRKRLKTPNTQHVTGLYMA